MIRFLLFPLLFVSCSANSEQAKTSSITSYEEQVDIIEDGSLLVGIQDKIYKAFVQGLMSEKPEALVELSDDLELLNKENKQHIIVYWRAYLQYYSAIYYLEKGDKEASEKEIDKGTEWLEEMDNKNSEDYALLALSQSFGIQFKGMKAMFIASDIKKNVQTAIAFDSLNIRGYYVYASNDYYTPEKYGGGKEAEKYLLKAITLPEQKVSNTYLPSWGKEEAYEMLIKLYIKNENWDAATKYYKEGIALYPTSYTITQLASQLVGR